MVNMQNNLEHMVFDVAQEENENHEEYLGMVESTNLDLESYASNFTGLAKLNRLMFIADYCPPLKIEALKMALAYVKTTFNVSLYMKLQRRLQTETAASGNNANLPDVAGGQTSVPPADTQWIESRSKKAALKLERLDAELKSSKINSIKESIRRGHDDLGDHYLDCGDLSNALKCYSRARDYCTSCKHIVRMCYNVIKVSVYLQNWTHVLSFVSKAQATPEPEKNAQNGSKQPSGLSTHLKCAAGLAHLATRKYKLAAKNFLSAQLDMCDFPELMSPSNVAIYGGLCALATFSRQELLEQVISSSSFKLFLETEPQLRNIIFKFYNSEYASCLQLLEEMRNSFLLDLHLARHIKTLYSNIRNRALIQYFSPYMSADMEKMAMAFNTNVMSLEDELMQLILDEQIQARIDSHNKVLYSMAIEERNATFEHALEMGRDHELRTKALILRSALLRNHIHVKSPPRDNGQNSDVSMGGNNIPRQSNMN